MPVPVGVNLRSLTATDAGRLAQAKFLLMEYVETLGIDLSFQNFQAEVDTFPAGYLAPEGALILALREDEAVGCIGVRQLDADVCEMKRLYVRDTARGYGLGRALCLAALNAGSDLGYARMRLDTLPSMAPARNLYRQLGFKEIAPYYHNPISGTSFMERSL